MTLALTLLASLTAVALAGATAATMLFLHALQGHERHAREERANLLDRIQAPDGQLTRLHAALTNHGPIPPPVPEWREEPVEWDPDLALFAPPPTPQPVEE